MSEKHQVKLPPVRMQNAAGQTFLIPADKANAARNDDTEPLTDVADETEQTSPEEPETADNAPMLSPKSKTGAYMRGHTQGATVGYGDELYGGLNAMSSLFSNDKQQTEADPATNEHPAPVISSFGHQRTIADVIREQRGKSPEAKPDRGFLDTYRDARDSARSDNEKARKAHPGYYLGGDIVGTISAPIPGATEAHRAMEAEKALKFGGEGEAAANAMRDALGSEETGGKILEDTKQQWPQWVREGKQPVEGTASATPEGIKAEADATRTAASGRADMAARNSKLAEAMKASRMAGVGAGYGGAAGLGTSDADLTRGEYGTALKDMAGPAAFGGMVGGAYEVAGDYLGGLVPKRGIGMVGEKLPTVEGTFPTAANRPVPRTRPPGEWKTAAMTAVGTIGLSALAGMALGEKLNIAGTAAEIGIGYFGPPLIKKLIKKWGSQGAEKMKQVLSTADLELERGGANLNIFGKGGAFWAQLKPDERRKKAMELMEDPATAPDVERSLEEIAAGGKPDGGTYGPADADYPTDTSTPQGPHDPYKSLLMQQPTGMDPSELSQFLQPMDDEQRMKKGAANFALKTSGRK